MPVVSRAAVQEARRDISLVDKSHKTLRQILFIEVRPMGEIEMLSIAVCKHDRPGAAPD